MRTMAPGGAQHSVAYICRTARPQRSKPGLDRCTRSEVDFVYGFLHGEFLPSIKLSYALLQGVALISINSFSKASENT